VKSTLVLISFGVAALLAGCGSEPGNDAASSPSSAPAATVPGAPPKPDQATADAYVADLQAIDPNIVDGKPDRVVSRGRDQCTSVVQWPNDQDKLVGLVQKRFTSADHPEGFGREKSTRILAAVRKHLCPTY